MASHKTLSKHPPCSPISHTCQPSYYPQRHLAPNHFKWSGDEHTWPLQVEPCWHMHSVPPNKYQSLAAAHRPVAFVKIVQVPSALPCISHVPISWCSKWPHLEMESCWTLSKHPQRSHILHTCQPSYSPQRHQTDNHIGWAWTSLLFSNPEVATLNLTLLLWTLNPEPYSSPLNPIP